MTPKSVLNYRTGLVKKRIFQGANSFSFLLII